MSKKMLKRTAALSALIAVALSGTVMAADYTNEITGTDWAQGAGAGTITGYENVTLINNNGSGLGLTDTTIEATGKVTIKAYIDPTYAYGINGYGKHSISAPVIEIHGDGDGIYMPAEGTTSVTIKDFDELTITAKKDFGVFNNGIAGQNSLVIDGNDDSTVTIKSENWYGLCNSNGGDSTITAGTLNITSNGTNSAVPVLYAGGESLVMNVGNMNVENTNEAWDGYTFYVTTGTTELNATGKVAVDGLTGVANGGTLKLGVTGADASFNGMVDTAEGATTVLNLNKGATWNMTGDSTISRLNGNVNVQGEGMVLNVINEGSKGAISQAGKTGVINVGELNVKAAQNNGISAYGDITITADKMTVDSGANSAIYAEYPSDEDITNSNITINVKDSLKVTGAGHGLNSGTSNAGSSITINGGETADITITAGENAVVTRGGDEGTITISGKDVTLESTNTGDQGDAKGHAIYAQGANSNVVINAAEDLKVTAVNGKNAVFADGNGSVVSVDAATTTIEGTVKAKGSADTSTINIGGDTITVNADGATGIQAVTDYTDVGNTAVINIGDADTTSVNINDASYGILVQYAGAEVNVEGQELNITNDSGDGVGVWVMNGTTDDTNPNHAQLSISEDTATTITMTDANGDPSGYAICNSSQGAIVDIAGDLEVVASTAVYTRGNAVTEINSDGGSTVNIVGDIVFGEGNPGDIIDATVNINLDNADSSLTGNIYTADTNDVRDDSLTNQIKGMDLTVSNGATWTSDEDSFANNLTVNNGNIVMASEEEQKITVDTFAGDGATITTNSLNNKFTAETDNATNTTVKGGQAIMAAFENSTEGNLESLAEQLALTAVDGSGKTLVTTALLEGNELYGDTTVTFTDGKATNVVTKENKANAGLIDMTALSFMAWRGENDDLNERLGNLRSAREDRGIWTRMARAEQSYNSVTNQYSMYQIGYDQQAGDWTLGAAYSYTDGKSWFEKGTGENTHNVFSLYGTKMNDNGTFVDLVAKYGNLDYDYTLTSGVGGGDYDTDAYSLSAEVGKRIELSTGAWVEPQLQLTYGTVDSVSFKTQNNLNVHLDSADSFVARAGIMAGKPVHKGNIYLKASYLYDFAGEVEGTFSNGKRSVDIARDLGGGWWEVGAGANFDLSDATHLYVDFEKAVAGEAEVEWKWNAGVRYSF